MTERQKSINFLVDLIYKADGMRRPLDFRQVVAAPSVREAYRLCVNFIGSAYVSGFEVVSWSAENLDHPVHLKYVCKAREEGQSESDTEEGVYGNPEQREDGADSGDQLSKSVSPSRSVG